jgi:long-chain acyl-CoA synthetase
MRTAPVPLVDDAGARTMNVADSTWRHAAERPAAVALQAAGDEWSYARLRDGAAHFAGGLAAAGTRPGDRVLLVAPSVPEFVVAYLGIHAAGAVAVTPNVMSTAPELSYVVADAGCSMVIAWHRAGPAAATVAAAAGLPFRRLDEDLDDSWDGPPVDQPHRREPTDTAVILYTSGTTGAPKGAQITVGNLRACAEAFGAVLELDEEDRFATALPLFHIFGQAVILGSSLMAGAGLALQARFDPAGLIEVVRRERTTVLAGVPTMYSAMLGVGDGLGPEAFASLRLAASGGASLPGEILRRFEERFGCAILEGYGLTESTGAATFNGLGRERKVGSVGIALPGTEVRIADADGAELPTGDIGEVLIKGPMVMKGYRGLAEESEKALDGGWLHTGDLGRKDADGDLEIVDRLKEMIVRGGYNVYPREVEEVLHRHPDIAEVAVVGVPDEHFGEEVGAVIVPRSDSSPDPAEIRDWAKEHLSAYKVPGLFAFEDELPKGATGKILKRSIDLTSVIRSRRAVHSPEPQGGPG